MTKGLTVAHTWEFSTVLQWQNYMGNTFWWEKNVPKIIVNSLKKLTEKVPQDSWN